MPNDHSAPSQSTQSTHASHSARPVPGRAAQLATRLAFLVSGVGTAIWAALVPFAKTRLDIGDGALGLLLLAIGAGSIVAMPLAGIAAARFGCRTMILMAGGLICLTLPQLAILSNVPALVVVMMVFGAAIGTLDVAMNLQAIIVERASGRAMMSGFHGLFSLGGIAGAGGMTGMLALQLSPVAATVYACCLLALALAIAVPGLLPYAEPRSGPAFALPRGVVLLIGVVAFVLFLTEGTVLDWSGVLMIEVRDAPLAYAGLGYTAFAVTMTIGRLCGDRIVAVLGVQRVVWLGGLCASIGIVLAAWLPQWQGTLAGYALVGLGAANIVPVAFSAAGRQTRMPVSVAVSAISTLGYAGILAGPALIGFISHSSTLPIALTIVAALLVGVAFSARWIGSTE